MIYKYKQVLLFYVQLHSGPAPSLLAPHYPNETNKQRSNALDTANLSRLQPAVRNR